MSSEYQRLLDQDASALQLALRSGELEMELGSFSMRLQAHKPEWLLPFLRDVYRDAPVRLSLGDVTDVSINVRPPNTLRSFIRPQVIPDPGFIVPAVPLPPRLAALALEMGLNLSVALKCCRFTTFHSAVVGRKEGSVLISAHSGGGKSTLAATMMTEGFRLFSDEFGLLDLDQNLLWPYPRPVSLKDRSIDIVTELTGRDWVSPRLMGTPKGDIAYRRARPSDIAQANDPLPCKLILFPVFSPGTSPQAKEIPPAEALMKLIPSSTNYHLLGERSFAALLKMVSSAQVYEITYGNTNDCMMMVRDLTAGAGM